MTTLLEGAQKAHNTLVNLSKLGNGNQVGNSTGNIIARDAAIELEQAIADEMTNLCDTCRNKDDGYDEACETCCNFYTNHWEPKP